MSETKTNKQELLEEFRSNFNHVVEKYEREIEKYTVKMNQDYEYFFRWRADELYKAHINLNALKGIAPMAKSEDLDKIKMWLKQHIENLELQLIEGTQYTSSSSLMVNLAGTLKRVAMQELREELKRLIWSLDK